MRSVMISSLILLMISAFAGAQVPGIINYQGRLTDDAGELVTDGEYPVRFRIWDDSTDGMMKWTSQPETVLVINGLFNFQLGSKENIPPSTFNDTSLWLGIAVGTGPEVQEIEPRTRLVSAPYAFKAYQAKYADSAEYASKVNSCAGIEILTIESYIYSQVRIIFPITFSNATNIDLSASAVVYSGSTGSGFPARIADITVTESYADLTVQCWDGSSYVDMMQDDMLQVSYTAIER